MARTASKNAHEVRSNKTPLVRGPYHRPRVAVSYDPERGLTHQSFKEECDITRIVETYARTGIIPTHRLEPHYGDAPEATLFEAACAQAEIRSALEDGFTPSEASSEAPEAPEGATGSLEPETPVEPALEAADA